MTVLLNRSYQGYVAGAVVDLPTETEAALISQGLASASSAALTAGAATTTFSPVQQSGISGTAAIAAGASSVAISNPSITTQSKAFAQVAQAAADATLTNILRVSCAAGAVTITGNANATAITEVSFLVLP